MTTDKKELAVAALRDGTVIDHIPCETLFKCVDLLGITQLDKSVTIGFNLESGRGGKKGIIKVADTFFPEEVISRIALVAPTAVINTIRNYEVVAKDHVVIPDEIIDIAVCNNPKCITRNEPMKSRFKLTSRNPVTLQCHYCEQEMCGGDIQIK